VTTNGEFLIHSFIVQFSPNVGFSLLGHPQSCEGTILTKYSGFYDSTRCSGKIILQFLSFWISGRAEP